MQKMTNAPKWTCKNESKIKLKRDENGSKLYLKLNRLCPIAFTTLRGITPFKFIQFSFWLLPWTKKLNWIINGWSTEFDYCPKCFSAFHLFVFKWGKLWFWSALAFTCHISWINVEIFIIMNYYSQSKFK